MVAIIVDKDYEKHKKAVLIVIKRLHHEIRKDFGSKCKTFCWQCSICQAYVALELLEDIYTDGLAGLKHLNK